MDVLQKSTTTTTTKKKKKKVTKGHPEKRRITQKKDEPVAHCLCHIRTPVLPIQGQFTVLLQPFLFLGQILMLIDEDHGWLFARILDSEKEKTRRLTVI